MSQNHLLHIEAQSRYEKDKSSPEENEFFFSYNIRITNNGQTSPQLLRRHWIITDGHGRVHEVKGDGVIGQQPVISPGMTFEYSSFCPLPTPTGTMKGYYDFVESLGGEEFRVEIPQFFLVEPSSFH